MAIKVNARETELKIGKNPGYYYAMTPERFLLTYCVLYVYSMLQICKDVTFFCRKFAAGKEVTGVKSSDSSGRRYQRT